MRALFGWRLGPGQKGVVVAWILGEVKGNWSLQLVVAVGQLLGLKAEKLMLLQYIIMCVFVR